MAYLSEFLNNQYMDFQRKEYEKTGRIPSQAEYARRIAKALTRTVGREIIIDTGRWSHWINGDRPPKREDMRLLARYYGGVIFDILGEPREMPDDPVVRAIDDAASRLDRPKLQLAARLIKALEEGRLMDELSKLSDEPNPTENRSEEEKSAA